MMSFKAKLRFAVMSDIHYSEKHPFVRDRFRAAMNMIYTYCEGEEYKKLDALYINGDFADRGSRDEMLMFYEDCKKYVSSDTMLVINMAGHELHYVDDYRESMANFREIFKMDLDRHEVIGGYHFISLSSTKGTGIWHDSFDEPKRRFLKKELEKAVKGGGNKPIFVFQHVGLPGTVSGGEYGNSELFPILSRYPQIIDFSGHSHFAVNNPKEIHQGHFTSVSSGSLLNIETYAEFFNPHIEENIRKNGECAHMLLAEVDDNTTVRIRKADVIAGDFFENDYYIESAWDRSKYKYTQQRAALAKIPYFDRNAAVKAYRTDGRIRIEFPKAKCEGERVAEYNIRLCGKNGTILGQKSYASDYQYLIQSDRYSVDIADKSEAEQVLIYAIGFWDNCSEAISAKISSRR